MSRPVTYSEIGEQLACGCIGLRVPVNMRRTNADWRKEDAPYKAQQLRQLIKRNGVAFRRCVDVGCGTGSVLHILAAEFDAEYIGFDVAPAAIELAQRNARPNVSFRCGDYTAGSDLGDIDLVLCNDVFEHVPDYLGFLTRLASAPRVHGCTRSTFRSR